MGQNQPLAGFVPIFLPFRGCRWVVMALLLWGGAFD